MGKNIISYKNVTLLLVDDDKELLESNALRLKDLGFKVICAENGREAIKIIETQHIDIVIIDYFMPDLTGEDTIREIRKFNIKVVILIQTGFSGEKPATELLKTLKIQGYHDKTNGFDQLMVWIVSSVRICDQ